MEMKLQKIYLTYYNLLIAWYLWQVHYQILSNLSEGIHRIKCKLRHDDKNLEACQIKCKYCDSFLEYTNFNDDFIECKCLLFNRNCEKKFDEKLKEGFFNTYKFSN